MTDDELQQEPILYYLGRVSGRLSLGATIAFRTAGTAAEGVSRCRACQVQYIRKYRVAMKRKKIRVVMLVIFLFLLGFSATTAGTLPIANQIQFENVLGIPFAISMAYLLVDCAIWLFERIHEAFFTAISKHHAARYESHKDSLPRDDSTLFAPMKSNAMAISGFILGVVSMFLYQIGILPILAIVFSAIGVGTFDPTIHKSRWMAWTGLVLGIIYTLMYMSAYGHFGH